MQTPEQFEMMTAQKISRCKGMIENFNEKIKDMEQVLETLEANKDEISQELKYWESLTYEDHQADMSYDKWKEQRDG